MSKVYWAGCAPALQMVVHWVFTYGSGTTYTVQLGSAIITQAAITDAPTTVAALVAKLQASGLPQFLEVTWSASSGTLIGTVIAAGVPIKTTCVTASGGTGSISSTTVTQYSSPNDISIAANWSTGAFPVDNDIIEFPEGSPSALYGLTYFNDNSIHIAQVNIPAAYTGSIGLPVWNSNDYLEYRPLCLTFTNSLSPDSAVVANIGYGPGSGSPLVNIDMGSNKILATITTMGSKPTAQLGAFYLANCVSGSTLEVIDGTVFLDSGVVLSSLTISGTGASVLSFQAQVSGPVAMTNGSASIPATTNMPITMTNGSSLTTIGSVALNGAINISSSSSPGPTLIMNNSGGWNGTEFNVGPYATVDLTQEDTAKDFNGQTVSLSSGINSGSKPPVASFLNGNGTAFNYTLLPVNCSIEQCNTAHGPNKAITVS